MPTPNLSAHKPMDEVAFGMTPGQKKAGWLAGLGLVATVLAGCGSSSPVASYAGPGNPVECQAQYIQRVQLAYDNHYPLSGVDCQNQEGNTSTPTHMLKPPSEMTTAELKAFLGARYDEVKYNPAFQTKDSQQASAQK